VSSVEYEVRSSVGALLFTTPDRKRAAEFARERQAKVPGLRLHVEEVTRWETRRRVSHAELRRVA